MTTVALRHGRWGLLDDPRGGHCVMSWQGRELLGTVVGVSRNEVTGATEFEVRHFCGEPWPVKPVSTAVQMLVREYDALEGR